MAEIVPGADIVTGGCQCGRVRFRVDVAGADAYLCHCRMCRRATGAAAAAFVNVDPAGLSWQGEPDWYASSPIARRPFCAACGTPLGFAFADGEGNVDLALGAFDAPGRFRPSHNYAVESLLPAWQDGSRLPGIRSEDNPNVARRWREAVGRLPD